MPMPDQVDQDAQLLHDAARRFALSQIVPNLDQWEQAGEFPRSLYTNAAELGWLGMGYPEALGGTPAPWRLRHATTLALARHGGSGGVMAGLFSHNIALPPVLRHASAELQQEVVPPVLRGECIAALAITEPGAGSDVGGLRCTARREGDDYVIDGEKVFITSGMRAHWLTVAVRTDLHQQGAGGISMLMVPGDLRGISRSPLRKMGWLCSDTAHLRFDAVRVPQRYLIGQEGAGFKMIMTNFNGERLSMAAMALGFSQCCLDEALAWARQRKAFGSALVDYQVIRHKLVDMQSWIESTQSWLHTVSAQADAGHGDAPWVASVCMLKNHATNCMQYCADQAVQILGGMGFMRGTASERIYREVKVMAIGGGTQEIMKELAARQLGI